MNNYYTGDIPDLGNAIPVQESALLKEIKLLEQHLKETLTLKRSQARRGIPQQLDVTLSLYKERTLNTNTPTVALRKPKLTPEELFIQIQVELSYIDIVNGWTKRKRERASVTLHELVEKCPYLATSERVQRIITTRVVQSKK